MKSHSQSIEPKIAEQAIGWLIELEDGESQALQEFATWLKQSPQHVQEFLFATAVWREFDDFDSERRIEIGRLVAAASVDVLPLNLQSQKAPERAASETRQSRPLRSRWPVAAAASLLLIASAGVFVAYGPMGGEALATVVGEQRVFTLDDGSVVQLNTRSRVRVQYSKDARDIRLLAGEALFTVERDPARPFRVHVGDAIVQAVGTQFNVYRRAEGATISVVEGVVRISESGITKLVNPASAAPSRLTAGEQANVSSGGAVVKHAAPDVAKAIAWRTRRFVFRADPLEEIAAEFNRYNTLQIRVEDDFIRGKRLTGVFDAADPESLVQFLAKDSDLSIENNGEVVVIRARE